MKYRRLTCLPAGPIFVAVVLLAGPGALTAQEATKLAAVLLPGVEQEFRAAQRELAQRRPTSRIALANIAIRQDRVEFLDASSGQSLALLQQALAPPWFASATGHAIDPDTQLLLQLLAERQRMSPWRRSDSAASRPQRDDWADQPMRKPWQTWLIASATWLTLLAIGWKALRTTNKKRHTNEH